MVHYLKLSKDSDCSLAMAHGLLGVNRPMRRKGKGQKWIIRVCPLLFPQASEKNLPPLIFPVPNISTIFFFLTLSHHFNFSLLFNFVEVTC